MKLLLPVLTLLLFGTSCSNNYQAEITAIDGLIVRLDSAKQLLQLLDTGRVFGRMDDMEKNVKLISTYADSINREEALVIEEYRVLKRAYEKSVKNVQFIYEDIETIPVQLENLKKDLSKNLVEPDKAQAYLLNETLAAESVFEAISDAYNQVANMENRYHISQEKILHLIQTLDNKGENDEES